MASENPKNASSTLQTDKSAAITESSDDVTPTPPKDTPHQDSNTSKNSEPQKESYEDYIKNLPPPFWQTKAPPTKPADSQTIAARINAVSAPVTEAQRAEDERLKNLSWREKWKERKARKEAEKKDGRDLRPVERGSRAQFNVFGSNVAEKRK